MGASHWAAIVACGGVLVCVLLAAVFPSGNVKLRKKAAKSVTTITQSYLQHLRKLDDLTDIPRFRNVFLPGVLKTRVSGTDGNREVREFIKSRLSFLNDWTVEEDEFNDTTPIGNRTFVNVVATLDPHARKRLVLAAHYDSKLIPADHHGEFVGATDSAVPCAMLLDVAYSLQALLRQRHRKLDVTLQLIFFDGEEAFIKWTDQDSLYGSRHLAAQWEARPHPVIGNLTQLKAIDVFVLLDLIGAPNPRFYNQYANTSKEFEIFQKLERRLAKRHMLHNHKSSDDPYFKPDLLQRPLGIDDDHRPFLHRGVPVVHLISVPFPSVWHKTTDNLSALDFDVIHNLNLILRGFVAEYLDLFNTKL